MGGLLLVSGLVSAWAIKRINSNYSELVARTSADLNRVQDLTLHAGIGYAAALELPVVSSEPRRAELSQDISRLHAANDKAFAELAQTDSDAEFRAALDKVSAKRKAWRDTVGVFLESAQLPSASRTELLSSGPMSRAFVEHQTACDQLSELIMADSKQANDEATHDMATLRLIMLGTSILPLAVGLALILLTFYAVWTSPAELDLHG